MDKNEVLTFEITCRKLTAVLDRCSELFGNYLNTNTLGSVKVSNCAVPVYTMIDPVVQLTFPAYATFYRMQRRQNVANPKRTQ